jgi:hypothetical protein
MVLDVLVNGMINRQRMEWMRGRAWAPKWAIWTNLPEGLFW